MRRRLVAAACAVASLSGLVVSSAGATPGRVVAPTLEVADDGLWELETEGWPRPARAIDAVAWIVVDVGSGQVLGGNRTEELRPPASTTKLLTALAVARTTSDADLVTVSRVAATQRGASSGLAAGQSVRVDDLLALLLLRSGNDAAVALAEHVGGSVDGFSEHLHREAVSLGLDGLVLQEPHGLEDRNRLSARHLAVIGRAVLANDRLAGLVGANELTLSNGRVVINRNDILTTLPGATGLKTGMTRAAGWSLVASARRGPRHLVAVVLGSSSGRQRFEAATTLLEFGFSSFVVPARVPALMLRGDATWLTLGSTAPAAMLPRAANAHLEPVLPVELTAPVVRWAWPSAGGLKGSWFQASRLVPATGPASVASASASVVRRGESGAGHLGAWLSGRVQAALRAATVQGLWADD